MKLDDLIRDLLIILDRTDLSYQDRFTGRLMLKCANKALDQCLSDSRRVIQMTYSIDECINFVNRIMAS